MIVSIGTVFNKIQHLFMMKTFKNLRRELPQPDKWHL